MADDSAEAKMPARPRTSRVGDAAAMVRLMGGLKPDAIAPENSVTRKRRLVADFCRLLGDQYSAKPPASGALAEASDAPGSDLAPRVAETLGRLLEGDSEKQIARHLRISPHTVHVYVKAIYRHFNVSSRGELLARFVKGGQKPNKPAAS